MDVEQWAKKLLMDAARKQASDVHILPTHQKGLIRYRINGELMDIHETSSILLQKMIAHLKFLSGMDIGERRRPQTSALEMFLGKHLYSLRLSTFPMTFSETLVIRLLRQGSPPPLKNLTLFHSQAQKLLNFSFSNHGLILICGPTGSGKTTTLYSLMNESIFAEKRNVISLEDPVERRHDEFLQMEVNEKAGVNYAEGLRNVLRHDPDVIMIGEIRDEETARMAFRAAMTGHLVLSTLHSSTTAMAVRRLEEFGMSRTEISETLLLAATQTLVRLSCPYCKEECHISCSVSRKRAAIFDILYGHDLQGVINRTIPPGSKMEDHMKKAYSLGYLSGFEIKKWERRSYVKA
ncbi:Flp pilus assembly complex ATPase component TadA [Bacillus sp. H-16]|uniref:Type II secretion system protein E n=2 Tax=Bacillaceae TaxID=186817 RepID=A0A3M7TY83_9BACI|nr:Flp pilus assembly complex ATPase component TadA [Alteribacter salitolerans]RNA70558.1 type II secretion system protein E [Alteribacter keqinensis]